MIIVFKNIKRDGSNKIWVLGLEKQKHNHDMSSNPLNYEIHQQRQSNYVKTLLFARTHRFSEFIYKQSMRILKNTFKESNETFHLKKKKYYNLISFITRSREDIFTDLLKCLNDLNFIIKVYYMYVKNEHDVLIKKVFQ